MTTIKTVAIAGATGNLGPQVLSALIQSGKFDITILKRTGSTSTVPDSVNVIEVDYNSVASLTAAFQGQDAIVTNLGFVDPSIQLRMVDVAIETGVKRFLPGEFGSEMNDRTRQLPVFANKVKVQDYLAEKCRTNSLTYTQVHNSVFLDWGLQTGFVFNMSEYKPAIYDDGNRLFSTTTTSTVGRAVVGVLAHFDETKNRQVYVQDAAISQNQLLAIAEKLTPGQKWEPQYVRLADVKAASDAKVAKGIYDLDTLYPYLFCGIFGEGYGGKFEKLDNELFGIKEMTMEDIEALVKTYLPKN